MPRSTHDQIFSKGSFKTLSLRSPQTLPFQLNKYVQLDRSLKRTLPPNNKWVSNREKRFALEIFLAI